MIASRFNITEYIDDDDDEVVVSAQFSLLSMCKKKRCSVGQALNQARRTTVYPTFHMLLKHND